jgi:hypothetical protein
MNEPSHRHRVLLGIMLALAAYSVVWPMYRSCLVIDINGNEAWNAYFSDMALRGEKLYPAEHELITNNYPPLSFYIVGPVGALVGDTVIAGRWLSLLGIGMIAFAVGLVIRQLGGGPFAALLGGTWFIATMCRFFTMYAGMNDPQILAHGIMTLGFARFLKAVEKDRGYALPILAMVLAGFIKHNIVTLPLVAFLWLGWQRPRRWLPNAAFAGALVVLGFAICRMAYGPDFFRNMLAPRVYSFQLMLIFLGHLQFVAPALVCWLFVGIPLRREPAVLLCNMLIAVGLAMFLLQKSGEGLGENAQFDLLIAASIALGIDYTRVPGTPLAGKYPAERLRLLFMLALTIRLLAWNEWSAVKLTDAAFHREIAERSRIMRECVEQVRNVPGDTTAAMILGYRAGKPFAIDFFNLDQRIKRGKVPADVVERRLAEGTLTRLRLDPRHSWLVDFR